MYERKQIVATLLRAGRRDLAMVVGEKRTAVLILYEPVRPIRQIVTRVLKKLRIQYQYVGRASLRSHGIARGRDEPRFYLQIDDAQARQVRDMIVQEQKKEGLVHGWELYL